MELFKEKLQQGKPLIGTLISMASSVVSETISQCGYDWMWIDMEHAPLSLEQVQHQLQAKAENCAAFVRIPGNDEIWIKQVLDLGADGIIVPQVKTADEAAKAVSSAKYPPTGTRSVGLARAHGFGMQFANYLTRANEDTLVLLQIEHRDGVRNIDQILDVPGIDAIIIGPYDMSGSFGKLGQIGDPEVAEAIDQVFQACQRRKIPIGIFALDAEQGLVFLRRGFQFVAIGIDVHYLWTAAKSSLESVLSAMTATTA